MFFPIGNDKKSPCGKSCKKILKAQCIQFRGKDAARWGYDYRYVKDGSYLDRSIISCLRDMGIPCSNNKDLIVIPEDDFLKDVLDQTPIGRTRKPIAARPSSAKATPKPIQTKASLPDTTRLITTPSTTKKSEPVRVPTRPPKNKNHTLELYRSTLLEHVVTCPVPGFGPEEFVFDSTEYIADAYKTVLACAVLLSTRSLQLQCIFISDDSATGANNFKLVYNPQPYKDRVIDHTYSGNDLEDGGDFVVRLVTLPSKDRKLSPVVEVGDGRIIQKCEACGHETKGSDQEQCDICSGTEFRLVKPNRPDIPQTFVTTILTLLNVGKFKDNDFSQIEGKTGVKLQDGPYLFIFTLDDPKHYSIIVNSGMGYSTRMLFWEWHGMTLKQLEEDIEAVRYPNDCFDFLEQKRVSERVLEKQLEKENTTKPGPAQPVAEPDSDYLDDRFVSLLVNACGADIKVSKVEKNRVHFLFLKATEDPFIFERTGTSFNVMKVGTHKNFALSFHGSWINLKDERALIDHMRAFNTAYIEWLEKSISDGSGTSGSIIIG